MIMDLLAEEELPVVISERCQGLIRALSQVKPHNSRHEIYDTDHETHSHPLDALRYLLVNMPRPSNWIGPVYEGPDMYSRWERGMLW